MIYALYVTETEFYLNMHYLMYKVRQNIFNILTTKNIYMLKTEYVMLFKEVYCCNYKVKTNNDFSLCL